MIGLVESDVALFTTTINRKDVLDKYYRVFKAQINMIGAHSRNPGYHSALHQEHYDVHVVKKGHDTPEKLATVSNEDLKRIKAGVLRTSSWVSIFIDDRHKIQAN